MVDARTRRRSPTVRCGRKTSTDPVARARPDPRRGARVRHLPHRPARRRGRAAHRCARPLVPGHQAVGRVVGRGRDATRFREGDRVGIAWLRRTCGRCLVLRDRPREPLRARRVHRLARRRRLRGVRGGGRGLRLRDPGGLQRRRGGAAALRGDHRLSRAEAGGGAAGRPAGHVRLRLLGPRDDPARPRPEHGGLRVHARARPPRAGAVAGRGLGGRRRTSRCRTAPRARSSSRRRASWCRSPCATWRGAGRWRWPAST